MNLKIPAQAHVNEILNQARRLVEGYVKQAETDLRDLVETSSLPSSMGAFLDSAIAFFVSTFETTGERPYKVSLLFEGSGRRLLLGDMPETLPPGRYRAVVSLEKLDA